jgi:serine/threonine protein phosphatase PrpC
MKSAGLSDVGKVRERNEDSYLINDELGLYIVADGMGGHIAGDIASRMAVEEIEAHVRARAAEPGEKTQEYHVETLVEAFRRANQAIFRFSRRGPFPVVLGTTAVAALTVGNTLYVAHVGDSRLYLYRKHHGRRMTKDHSQVQELIDFGHLTEDEAENHVLSNVITRSLGGEQQVEVDVAVHPLEAGDTLLLCTDGLRRVLGEAEIEAVIEDTTLDVETICRKLVDRTLEGGAPDNVTVIVVRGDTGEQFADNRGSTRILGGAAGIYEKR